MGKKGGGGVCVCVCVCWGGGGEIFIMYSVNELRDTKMG